MNPKIYELPLIAVLLVLFSTAPAHAASKRVYIYSLSQQYWDVRPGETLAYIASALLPGEPKHRQQLMQDILQLNPAAFIENDPDRLLANTRLWLPNAITKPISEQRDIEIQRFEWGYIKRSE